MIEKAFLNPDSGEQREKGDFASSSVVSMSALMCVRACVCVREVIYLGVIKNKTLSKISISAKQ